MFPLVSSLNIFVEGRCLMQTTEGVDLDTEAEDVAVAVVCHSRIIPAALPLCTAVSSPRASNGLRLLTAAVSRLSDAGLAWLWR